MTNRDHDIPMPNAIPVTKTEMDKIQPIPDIPFNEGFVQVNEKDDEPKSAPGHFILNG